MNSGAGHDDAADVVRTLHDIQPKLAARETGCDQLGVAKSEGVVDFAYLEHFLREDLNKRALRRMAVLKPLKVTLENYPEGQVEMLECVNNPEDPSHGTRMVPFSRVLYLEQEDFREDPPKMFYRLAPGREVRLRYAYFITCKEVIKDPATGEVIEFCDPRIQSIKKTIEEIFNIEIHNHSLYLYGNRKKAVESSENQSDKNTNHKHKQNS